MKIIIYGTGQIGRVVSQILKDAGHEVIGYVDDNVSLHSKKINGIQVLGGGRCLLKRKKYDRVCLGIGTIDTRKKTLGWLSKNKIKLISAIHPSVIISSDAKIGKGVIIGANSVVYGNTKIGLGTFILGFDEIPINVILLFLLNVISVPSLNSITYISGN